ncbi:YjhX family toxin [Jiella marina]|uniref:YjhX family toxin n=1 Tax=Jiella sp. LLJ827 TaxID=2917712 RepID=UPI002100AFE7|nr:YjhX family toxin [Jiella sp. LLJ827]MCQ0989629.1 YjhX family toxin [Jiella sp. LLJ827]
MDISRDEQRILHLLAQGGRIELVRNDINRKIEAIHCYTREGWLYPGLDLFLFRKLKRRKAISSRRSEPYRITERGLRLVRAQLDNR